MNEWDDVELALLRKLDEASRREDVEAQKRFRIAIDTVRLVRDENLLDRPE
jgi:hypothetical protein